jgi:L-alanine-DL-glutamate epimerase-like enolase superfamily enzyme
MSLRILDFTLRRTDVRLRMPFRYGMATMTDGPVVFISLEVEVDGVVVTGVSSDLLPPRWFTEVPGRAIEEEIAEMLQVIRQAGKAAVGMRGATAFATWTQLYEAQEAWAASEQLPPLLSNFGVSLVERALLDAVSRGSGSTFGELLRRSRLGIDLGRIHAELRGLPAAGLLPADPLGQVTVRHTVGFGDPLTDEEILPAERVPDGLPQSLAASVAAYGLRHFKLKVSGEPEADRERLSRIAGTLRAVAPRDFAFSLDLNEQFESVAHFRDYWEGTVCRSELSDLLGRLLFVEQPLARAVALHPDVREGFEAWPGRPPIIIDESDARLYDCAIALDRGYAGTSHKNCKGIFKGIANRCLLAARRRERPDRLFLMSGEDLCTIGPVALLQDLALMATLGIASVERNGHHYHAGLSQFPRPVQQQVLEAHGDLYQPTAAGWPTLRVTRGAVSLDSINRAPFGVGFALDTDLFASC